MTKWLRLKGTSGGHLLYLPAQVVIPTPGCPGLSPEIT